MYMEQIVYIHKVEVQHHNMGVVEIYIVEELVVIPMGVALLVDMAVAMIHMLNLVEELEIPMVPVD